MSLELLIFNISIIAAGAVCLFFGVSVLTRSRARINIIFFLLSLLLFFNSIFEYLTAMAPNPYWARIWFMPGNATWLVFFALLLHFSLVFSGNRHKWAPLIYIPAILMFAVFNFTPVFISGFSMGNKGYSPVLTGTYYIYILFYLSYLLAALFSVFFVYRTSRASYQRKQAAIMLPAILFPAFIGTLFNNLFPLLRLQSLPLGIHSIAFTLGFVAYAIIRYVPVPQNISASDIAASSAEALKDGLILVDNKKIINYANSSLCKLAGYLLYDLQGKKIEDLL
ncbi:MAG: histidine kinase N-terminal 7TM domain-containing protein, partial [Candidatus Margulisiibacteriota bacterium]